jgi:hypothetical protein
MKTTDIVMFDEDGGEPVVLVARSADDLCNGCETLGGPCAGPLCRNCRNCFWNCWCRNEDSPLDFEPLADGRS